MGFAAVAKKKYIFVYQSIFLNHTTYLIVWTATALWKEKNTTILINRGLYADLYATDYPKST